MKVPKRKKPSAPSNDQHLGKVEKALNCATSDLKKSEEEKQLDLNTVRKSLDFGTLTFQAYFWTVAILNAWIWIAAFDNRSPIQTRLAFCALPIALNIAGLFGLWFKKAYLLTGPVLMHVGMLIKCGYTDVENGKVALLIWLIFVYVSEMIKIWKSRSPKRELESLKEIKTEK